MFDKSVYSWKAIIAVFGVAFGLFCIFGNNGFSSTVRNGIANSLLWDMELSIPVEQVQDLLNIGHDAVQVDDGVVVYCAAAKAKVVDNFASCGKTVFECSNVYTVFAVCDGVVEKVSEDEIILINTYNMRFIYTGLDNCRVLTGDKVNGGDIIASAGNGGRFAVKLLTQNGCEDAMLYLPEENI